MGHSLMADKRQDHGRNMRQLSTLLPSIVGTLGKKHGVAATDLLTAWPDIVGTDLAARCRPVKISGGAAPGRQNIKQQAAGHRRQGRTLVLAARRADALEVDYAGDEIIDQVNAYLGPGAIARIRVEPVPDLPRAVQKRAPAPAAPADTEGLDGIVEEGLRSALARLQGALKSHRR